MRDIFVVLGIMYLKLISKMIGCVKGDNCIYRFGISFFFSFIEFFGIE